MSVPVTSAMKTSNSLITLELSVINFSEIGRMVIVSIWAANVTARYAIEYPSLIFIPNNYRRFMNRGKSQIKEQLTRLGKGTGGATQRGGSRTLEHARAHPPTHAAHTALTPPLAFTLGLINLASARALPAPYPQARATSITSA